MLHCSMELGDSRQAMPRQLPVVYRKLAQAEASLLTAHLRRLDPRDWRARFQGGGDRDSVRLHTKGLDWNQIVVLGAFIDGRLRGVAELHPFMTASGKMGEIALTVEARFQNRGIGTELLRRAINAARNRGIGQIQLLFMTDNHRMRRLIEKFSGAVANDLDQSEGRIKPLPSTFATLLEEWVEDSDTVGAQLRRALRPLMRPARVRLATWGSQG
jgi:RimJ/RimL family protein N-acetyltransferase